MKQIFTSIIILISINLSAQIRQTSQNIFQAKEFSKDQCLYKAKTFLIHNVLNTKNTTQFEAIPLAAASSGELTTLLYRSTAQNLDGLILGFFGDYWSEASGASFQGYGFKNLPKAKAMEFLNKIEDEIEKNKKFLKENNDNNNIAFDFDDLKVMIWTTSGSYLIRVYWNDFDSTWESTSFERSKRRFERKIK